jgi:hypothetical protein
MQVVERDERDMEEVGPAPGIVARQRDDLRLHLRRRLGHDVEGGSGAHRRECSMMWGRGGLAAVPCGAEFRGLVSCHYGIAIVALSLVRHKYFTKEGRHSYHARRCAPYFDVFNIVRLFSVYHLFHCD